MSLGPSQGRFQFLPRPKIAAGRFPWLARLERRRGTPSACLGFLTVSQTVRGGVLLGVGRKLVQQVQDKSLDRSDVFIFLFS